MSREKTDKDLLEGIKADNEVAFRSIYDKYYKLLAYTAYRTYPDEHKAKDFAQEIFMDIWRKRKSLEIHTSLGAFLKRAVTNKAIDFIRAQRFNFGEAPELERDPILPFRTFENEELKALIHKTAEKLPERCRMVFFLSRFEGLSHKEIASKLEISEKTIENQITKALKALRSVVNKYFSESHIILLFYFFS